MVDPLAPTPDGVDSQKWAAACSNVRSYCGWHIAPSLVEDVEVDGRRGSQLLLPSLHVTNVEDVEVDGSPVGVYEWTKSGTLESTWPAWIRLPWWPTASRRLTLTLTHGFEECPPEIVEVLDDLVKVGGIRLATRSQVGPFAHAWSQAASGGAGGVLGAYAGVLGPYRIEPAP